MGVLFILANACKCLVKSLLLPLDFDIWFYGEAFSAKRIALGHKYTRRLSNIKIVMNLLKIDISWEFIIQKVMRNERSELIVSGE